MPGNDGGGSRLMNAYLSFHQRHERLKNYVHNGFRYPLPPWGRAVMGFVYFSLPVVIGYPVMQWAISKSHAEIGERGMYRSSLIMCKRNVATGSRIYRHLIPFFSANINAIN